MSIVKFQAGKFPFPIRSNVPHTQSTQPRSEHDESDGQTVRSAAARTDRNTKRCLLLLGALLLLATSLQAQNDKRERKKNLTVKEWNLKAGSHTPVLDNVVTYDDQGRKVEEIEYASYGQKKRTVYQYQGNSKQCHMQIEYNDKNRPARIKKFEYNDDGTRKKQYNYSPNGKLESTKDFEYSYK